MTKWPQFGLSWYAPTHAGDRAINYLSRNRKRGPGGIMVAATHLLSRHRRNGYGHGNLNLRLDWCVDVDSDIVDYFQRNDKRVAALVLETAGFFPVFPPPADWKHRNLALGSEVRGTAGPRVGVD